MYLAGTFEFSISLRVLLIHGREINSYISDVQDSTPGSVFSA